MEEAQTSSLAAAPTAEDPPATATTEPTAATESCKTGLEDRTCFKCGKVMQSRGALHLHLNRVFPCDMKKGERPDTKKPEGDGTKTCNKCGKTFTKPSGLRLHLLKVIPCDAPEVQAEMTHMEQLRQHKEFKCEKCQKVFASGQSLRNHRSRVFPCDDPKSERGNKTCPKCHTTFCSAQSLRFHLNRVTPCDAIKPSTSKSDEEKQQNHPIIEAGEEKLSAAPEVGRVYTCPKCQKKFGSEHGLRIHIGRMTARAQIIPAKEVKESMPNVAQHDEERTQNIQMKRKVHAACLERLGRSGDADATNIGPDTTSTTDLSPSPEENSADNGKSNVSSTVPTSEGSDATHDGPFDELLVREAWHRHDIQEPADTSRPYSRKRIADSGREGLVEKKRKRSSNEIGPFAELGARLAKKVPATTIPQDAEYHPSDLSSDDSRSGHGGDILTDGCCCCACVRKWARRMVDRIGRVYDEVNCLQGVVTMDVDAGAFREIQQNSIPNRSASPCIPENVPLQANDIDTQEFCDSSRENYCSTPEMAKRANDPDPPANISSPAPRNAKLCGNDEILSRLFILNKKSRSILTCRLPLPLLKILPKRC